MVLNPAWITAIGSMVTGLGAGLGGWAALRGVNAWRIEALGRRKAELAEEVLAQFYRARDALIWARLPAEGAGGDASASQSPEAAARGASAMAAPIERLNQASQVFSELQASRYRFMAYFGEEAARPFDELRKVHDDVVEASSRLIRRQGKPPSTGDATDRDTIGWGPYGSDQLAERLERAVRAIELICRPLIEEPRTARPRLPRRAEGRTAATRN